MNKTPGWSLSAGRFLCGLRRSFCESEISEKCHRKSDEPSGVVGGNDKPGNGTGRDHVYLHQETGQAREVRDD